MQAAAVAHTFGARLTVVFACEAEDRSFESLQCAEDRLRSWLPAEAGTEYDVHPVVRHGDAAEQVISLARETAADLIVIGAQHRRFVDTTVLGVTTVRVTRHAPCPVLVVPRPVEEELSAIGDGSNQQSTINSGRDVAWTLPELIVNR